MMRDEHSVAPTRWRAEWCYDCNAAATRPAHHPHHPRRLASVVSDAPRLDDPIAALRDPILLARLIAEEVRGDRILNVIIRDVATSPFAYERFAEVVSHTIGDALARMTREGRWAAPHVVINEDVAAMDRIAELQRRVDTLAGRLAESKRDCKATAMRLRAELTNERYLRKRAEDNLAFLLSSGTDLISSQEELRDFSGGAVPRLREQHSELAAVLSPSSTDVSASRSLAAERERLEAQEVACRFAIMCEAGVPARIARRGDARPSTPSRSPSIGTRDVIPCDLLHESRSRIMLEAAFRTTTLWVAEAKRLKAAAAEISHRA